MAEIPPSFPSVIGLGKPQSWFPVRNWNRVGNLVIALVMLAGACLVILYGIYDASVAFHKHGLAVLDDHLFLPLVIAGIMFLLGGLGGWGAYANWNKGALLCEKGFALRTHRGIQPWIWDEISSIDWLVVFSTGISRRLKIALARRMSSWQRWREAYSLPGRRSSRINWSRYGSIVSPNSFCRQSHTGWGKSPRAKSSSVTG
jgi:hypothetical protein